MKTTVTANPGTPIQMNLEPFKRMALSIVQPTAALLVLYGEIGKLQHRTDTGNVFSQTMCMASVIDGISADNGEIVEYDKLHSMSYYHKKMAAIVSKYGSLRSILEMWDVGTGAYTAECGEISPRMPELVYYAPQDYFSKLFFVTTVIWDAWENGKLTTLSNGAPLYVLSFIEKATSLFDQANNYKNNANYAQAENNIVLLHHAQYILDWIYGLLNDDKNTVADVITAVCTTCPNGWNHEFEHFNQTAIPAAPAAPATTAAPATSTATPAPAAPTCTIPNIMDL